MRPARGVVSSLLVLALMACQNRIDEVILVPTTLGPDELERVADMATGL